MKRKILHNPALIVLFLSLFFVGAADAHNKARNTFAQPSGSLWKKVNLCSQDLFYGNVDRSAMPNLNRIAFIREKKGGYSGLR